MKPSAPVTSAVLFPEFFKLITPGLASTGPAQRLTIRRDSNECRLENLAGAWLLRILETVMVLAGIRCAAARNLALAKPEKLKYVSELAQHFQRRAPTEANS
jgi:hypothetical protein